jgi:hypothetical protein
VVAEHGEVQIFQRRLVGLDGGQPDTVAAQGQDEVANPVGPV